MASLKVIKKRITSVKSTQKITRAMKLVSAAKLKRATERAQQSRPYEDELSNMVTSILADTRWSSGLAEKRELKRVALLVFSSDRGLCGSLNANLFKAVSKRVSDLSSEGVAVEIVALGKKASDFYRKRGVAVFATHTDLIRKGSAEKMANIAREMRTLFREQRFDAVEVFYSRFISAIAQKPTQVQVLPFQAAGTGQPKQCLFEPGKTELLDSLVPMLLDFQLYRLLLESIASEHAARMAAMESATKNSKEMIERLTLLRNRARQALITKELMEIIGGAEAISA
jgi:F-type H+-transporting ATPase subunit gamma